MDKEEEEVKLINTKKQKWINLDGLGRIYLKGIGNYLNV